LKLKNESSNDNINESPNQCSFLPNPASKNKIYRVSDVIIFNGGKTFGYVIQVLSNALQVVSDYGQAVKVDFSEVEEKML